MAQVSKRPGGQLTAPRRSLERAVSLLPRPGDLSSQLRMVRKFTCVSALRLGEVGDILAVRQNSRFFFLFDVGPSLDSALLPALLDKILMAPRDRSNASNHLRPRSELRIASH